MSPHDGHHDRHPDKLPDSARELLNAALERGLGLKLFREDGELVLLVKDTGGRHAEFIDHDLNPRTEDLIALMYEHGSDIPGKPRRPRAR